MGREELWFPRWDAGQLKRYVWSQLDLFGFGKMYSADALSELVTFLIHPFACSRHDGGDIDGNQFNPDFLSSCCYAHGTRIFDHLALLTWLDFGAFVG